MSGAETYKQKQARLKRMMLAMAKAHDNNVSEREQGAVSALRCANGMATHYWQEIAKAALRASDLGTQLGQATARAEAAEARVKVLEEAVREVVAELKMT